MPVNLEDGVAALKSTCPGLGDEEARRGVRALISAFGLDVDSNGEVYNPAEGAHPTRRAKRDPFAIPTGAPRQQNVRWSGGRRR